ncbi:hypothetical protein D7Z94_15105 [Ulvibacterium marinum]|uniref:Uncharacterized protein n=1 Tax=Ulvibacterium marinum TaxID=2419782 RepID=A0A3B0C2H4_9FLAO|nr:hypothetical protein D7Z94_15105 [Ulvibacterium marinum]
MVPKFGNHGFLFLGYRDSHVVSESIIINVILLVFLSYTKILQYFNQFDRFPTTLIRLFTNFRSKA